ncbi:phytoene desaturase family protein [Sorangium sp. So ce388]|uniref:phytoene desaturase family protein n=1 Tax=Sorangium sp. So ce388 TaxID=3133309 RepID=UPI003F5AEDC3
MQNTKDVVVIGGGLAGLAAAAYLGRAGRSVALIEKAHAPGGRAATQESHGFSMNLGAHALYCGGAAHEVLGELGVRFTGAPPPASGAFALDRGAFHTMPSGALSLLTTGLFGLAAKLEMARVLGGLAAMNPAPLASVPVSAWLRDAFRTPEVRRFVGMLVRLTTYCADDDRQSAGAALAQLQLAFAKGVLYLDGGWKTLVDGLRGAATAAGVEILTGVRATRIGAEGGAVSFVELANGERLDTGAALVAASPRAAAALAPESPALAAHAARAVPVHAACLDVALSRLPRPRFRVALGVDRPLYLSLHSDAARLAPAGGALFHAVQYGPELAGRAAERELEDLLDRALPGYRDVLVERRFLPSLVVSNAVVAAEGGGYAARPGVRVPDLDGLFLAGDWVGPTGMLADASLGSARDAAGAILARGARRPLDRAA